jgi:DNA-binding transcriptional LysR family regulator
MLEEQVAAAALDACFFLKLPGLAHRPGIEAEPLFADPLGIVLPKGHPLSRFAELPLRRLAGEPFVTRARSAGARVHDAQLSWCNSAGFAPRIVQTSTSEPSSLTMVAAGLGFAILTRSVVEGHRYEVEFRPMVDPVVECVVELVWREHDDDAAVRNLIAIAREAAGRA